MPHSIIDQDALSLQNFNPTQFQDDFVGFDSCSSCLLILQKRR